MVTHIPSQASGSMERHNSHTLNCLCQPRTHKGLNLKSLLANQERHQNQDSQMTRGMTQTLTSTDSMILGTDMRDDTMGTENRTGSDITRRTQARTPNRTRTYSITHTNPGFSSSSLTMMFNVFFLYILGDRHFYINDVNTQVEFKSNQWFGATVRSQGNSVLVRLINARVQEIV